MSPPSLPYATDRAIDIRDATRRALEAHDIVRSVERRTGQLGLADFLLASLPHPGPFDERRLKAVYETSHELRTLYGQNPDGVLMPWEILRRDLSTTTAASVTGGRHNPIEDVIRPISVVATAGARIISGVRAGALHLPLVDHASEPQWITEGNPAPQSEPDFKLLSIQPSTLGAQFVVSRSLLLHGGPALEQSLREHLSATVGATIDRAILAGSGTDPEPQGILNHPDVPTVSLGTNGGPVTWGALAEVDRLAMAGARGNQPGAWVTNDKVMKALRTTPRGSGLDYIAPGRDLLGRTVLMSEHVPSNLTKGTGTNLSALVTGSWREAVVVVWGGGLDISVDAYTKIKDGRVVVTAHADIGFGLTRPEAFSRIIDLQT